MTWTQAICHDCWDERNPDRPSDHARLTGDLEVCAYCGAETYSGIYVRADPATVPFPREDE